MAVWTSQPLSESDVKALFSDFEIVRFFERDGKAKTSLGRVKHWHTYSVVAVKRREQGVQVGLQRSAL
ncbi:hypothetical protein KDW99_13595 [Marinomonas rhizomae]|uniref:hypothetical protein n=1 Tax=Marinomonas rhizomae TaxID=491948 RepID=UPI0021054179|nr:hypothetical protein [Marinomonas rhizomae]UTV98294.1 hypothetical protein KDW99_13595 [Marinomonas rhizomae]